MPTALQTTQPLAPRLAIDTGRDLAARQKGPLAVQTLMQARAPQGGGGHGGNCEGAARGWARVSLESELALGWVQRGRISAVILCHAGVIGLVDSFLSACVASPATCLRSQTHGCQARERERERESERERERERGFAMLRSYEDHHPCFDKSYLDFVALSWVTRRPQPKDMLVDPLRVCPDRVMHRPRWQRRRKQTHTPFQFVRRIGHWQPCGLHRIVTSVLVCRLLTRSSGVESHLKCPWKAAAVAKLLDGTSAN